MYHKIRKFMEQYEMIRQGDHVLVGVSGGADSLCLLCLLKDLAREWKFEITVLHVEHGIRGDESLKDMEFVQRICKSWDIPCIVRRFDVPAIAKEQGLSEEEAGRKVRYQALEEEAGRIGADRIAVAHHANDLMETMLFFLCRGTGLAGLAPMQPVRGNLIRPLLCVTRRQIEEYLTQQGLSYCEDATNRDTDYTRNKIRHEVIPVLEKINPLAVEHFGQTAEILRQAGEVLKEQVEQAYLRYVQPEEDGLLLKLELAQERQEYLVCEVIRKALETLTESRKDISKNHIDQIRNLFGLQVGKSNCLPYNVVARRSYGGVSLFTQKEDLPGQEPKWEIRGCLHTRMVEQWERTQEIPTKLYTKWMDYDIIKDGFSVRRAEPEDFLIIDGQGNRKLIKKLFKDEKIPSQKRDQIPVMARGNHVFWAIGVRMGEDVKITPATRQVMEISFYQEGEETHE